MTVKIISRTHVVPVHCANAVTGEVPYWDASTGMVWWVDIQGQRLLGFSPESGRTTCHNLPSMPGVIAGRRSGGLLIGLEDGIYAFTPESGLGPRLIEVEADNPLTRMNDGKPDAAGRLWFGTMDKTGRFQPIGSLYRLDADGSLHRVRANVHIPNGIDFSPDGRRMYYADTHRRVIEIMDYDVTTGTARNPTDFATLQEPILPDGCCIDAEGAMWIALVGAGRIERRLPDGNVDTVIELPVSRPTMPLLGGADGRTLFITSQRRLLDPAQLAAQPLAGDLLAVRVDVRAAPVHLAAL